MFKLLARPSWRKALMATAVLISLSNVGDHSRASAGPQRDKAWFEARSAFVFPLGSGPLPVTRDELADALTRGYRAHWMLPEDDAIVQANGEAYPALASLHLRLDGAVSKHRESEKVTPLKPTGKVESHVAVSDFDLNAWPLVYDRGAKLDIHMAADHARLDIQRAEGGKSMAILTDANAALLQFQVTRPDLETLLVANLNQLARNYGVSVRSAHIKLTTVNDRSIDVDVHLSTRLAFVPAGFRFQAHVDIDREMNARLSSLRCEGDEALGPLISNIIRPGLAKYEGKTRPVFSFPNGQLQLRQVTIEGGEKIKVAAMFAR